MMNVPVSSFATVISDVPAGRGSDDIWGPSARHGPSSGAARPTGKNTASSDSTCGSNLIVGPWRPVVKVLASVVADDGAFRGRAASSFHDRSNDEEVSIATPNQERSVDIDRDGQGP